MIKNKIFLVLASIFILAASNQNTVFAEEMNEVVPVSNLPAATFEAEPIESTEVAELKQMLTDLQSELVYMKSGMQDLQAKWVESEMEKLQAQLTAIRGNTITLTTAPITAPSLTISLPEINPIKETAAEEEPTLEVTSLKDFVGFEIDTEESTEAIEDTVELEELMKDSTEITSILETADAEITKLEAILAAKKALDEDETAHAEITEKITALKSARTQLEEISIEEAVEKLTDETTETKAEVSSNIIAQAKGEVLFQFPRAISQTTGDTAKIKNLGAGNLTADLLSPATNENNFERSSAPHQSWKLFSATSLAAFTAVLATIIMIFVAWLIRNERRLLTATSRRFQQLDLKPSLKLKNHTKKTRAKNKIRDRKIIQ